MKKVDDRKRTRDKFKSISKLELKDDGLHLANYAAVNFNKKIAEFHNKKSAPSADDREDEIQRKFWKKHCKKFEFNCMTKIQKRKVIFK